LRRLILGAKLYYYYIIEVLYPEKMSFRPLKWPQKFRNRKTAKNSKLQEDFFEPVVIVGLPPISTWITKFIFNINKTKIPNLKR
jgi:hypothetical protein